MAVKTDSSADKERSSIRKVRDVLGTRKTVTAETIRKGLPVGVVGRLGKQLQMTQEEALLTIKLSKQTNARRQKQGKLNPEESDRVWRVADLITKATRLLGDEETAAEWLRTSAPALNGETPLERASSEIGARDVEDLIGRLEHGIPT